MYQPILPESNAGDYIWECQLEFRKIKFAVMTRLLPKSVPLQESWAKHD